MVLVAVGGGIWVKGQYFNMERWVGFSECQLTSTKTTITQVCRRKDFYSRQITDWVNSNDSSQVAVQRQVDSLHLNIMQPNYLLVNE